jgi:cytochrome c peroxidase
MVGCSGETLVAPVPRGGDGGADADAARPEDAGCTVPYPAGPYGRGVTERVADLAFDAFVGAGAARSFSLHELYEPCAARPHLVVLRIGAGFCGTCRWHAANDALLAKGFGERLRVVDVLVSDEDNMLAGVAVAERWRALTAGPDVVAADPQMRLVATREPLPAYVLVTAKTMQIVARVSNPPPEELEWHVAAALATMDQQPAPPPPVVSREDGRFSKDQWALLHEMTLPGAPPPDPTNAKADDPAAAALGAALFSDASLSPSGTVSCATCHDPKKDFTDGLPQSVGVATGDRNAPSVLLAAHARWQFWDGRADTLWMQAAGPVEDGKEMASSRLFVAHRIAASRKAAYEAVWGPLPPLSDGSRFPPSGKPGDPAWTQMATGDQELVTRVHVNVAKSIAAFERTLRVAPNALDAYVAGDLGALSPPQKDGLAAFFAAGCAQCHWGPRLTDDAFHDVRFPTGRQDQAADTGWRDGILRLMTSELHAGTPWSDAPQVRFSHLAPVSFTLGTMKTPPLRGVASTAPYGHGGTLATLGDVLELYAEPGLPDSDPRATGQLEPWLPKIAPDDRDMILPFLRVLEAHAQ